MHGEGEEGNGDGGNKEDEGVGEEGTRKTRKGVIKLKAAIIGVWGGGTVGTAIMSEEIGSCDFCQILALFD